MDRRRLAAIMSAGHQPVQASLRLLQERVERLKQLAGHTRGSSYYYTRAMLFERKKIFDGRVIQVSVDTVDLPNGVRLPLEIVRHPGGAAAVAIDAENRVCLLRQYRHAAGGYIYELPAGKLEPNEAPEITVQRELAEEAAVSATHWESLGTYFSSPGVFTEVIHLYLATQLSPATAAPESSEVFQVEWWPLQKAVEQALNGELADAKTIIGILRAASRQKIA
jgi:8-oxo-dGTP pyrophosphatase MutT (NUDIX family)